MEKKTVPSIALTLLLLSTLTLVSWIQLVEAEPKTWTVNDDGSADFNTIQEAINAATLGDTIYVYNGTYSEHLTVNKSLTLTGNDKRITIIDGSLNGTAVTIDADNVKISEFTIQNGNEGIIVHSHGNNISHNNITLNKFEGLIIENSINNVITNNQISFNGWDGVYMSNTSSTALRSNTITSNNITGVFIEVSYDNTLSDNTLSNNTKFGVRLDDSNHISVVGNNIFWNELAGISLFNVTDSVFYHNNFLNNTEQIRSDDSPNAWDNGAEGNYWSDYNGTDLYSGLGQNETGSDGIGDTPYFVDNINQDSYPLMGLIWLFDVGTWNGAPHSVNVVSNSTISKFHLNRTERTIGFNVTGETGLGFCRVTLPNVIVQGLWQNGYEVLVDGEDPLILNSWPDASHTYVYFTYLHSEHQVIIQASDTTPPTISILSPENKTYPAKDIPLTFTINETAFWIGYSLDGQMNVTISGNTTISGLSDGAHFVIVYANDTAGNMGHSDTLYLIVDTTSPDIVILSPENKTYTTSSVSLSFTLNESTSWIGYSLDNQANVTITGNTTLPGLSNGSHSLIVHASDTVGNTGASETIHFTIEPPQQEAAAFPTWIIAVILIVALVVVGLLVYFTKVKKATKKVK